MCTALYKRAVGNVDWCTAEIFKKGDKPKRQALRRRSLHEIELLRRMAAPDAGESPRDDGVREDATGG